MNNSYDNLTKSQKAYVDAIRTHGATLSIDITKDTFSRAELRQISLQEKGKIWIPNWITHDQSRRAGRGVFNIPEVVTAHAEFMNRNADDTPTTEAHTDVPVTA